ncbi:MAG: hypothetical protein M1327_02795 [Candidatus Thermoplasmatota archaeon]|nr:hypothetical protein [Candidatus Thermoplasmatota archaeon]
MDSSFNKVFEVNTSCSRDSLWKILSRTESIPEFWHGTRWIKHIQGNSYQIRFAFPAKGIVDFTYDSERNIAKERYKKGPFKGEKIISIIADNEKTIIRVEWNVRFAIPYSILAGKMRNHMSQGTDNAINRIISAATGSQ